MKTLVITDDDTVFRERLARAFRERGYTVHTCADGVALQKLAPTVTPDYAILDLLMPGANGIEVLDFLLRAHPHCVVLLLTGYGSIATAIQAVKRGAHDYLSKPADADQIEAALLGRKPTQPSPISPPTLERVEWEHLQRVLADHGGNISRTARALGIDRRSLQRKLQKFPPER
jgi:two-component system, response regulator RegA